MSKILSALRGGLPSSTLASLAALALLAAACNGGGSNGTGGTGGGTGGTGGSTGGTGGSGGTGGGGSGGMTGAVSYKRDVEPLFKASCNDCHDKGSAINYNLVNPFDPADGIIRRPNSWAPNGSPETVIVDPGNPSNSFLIRKVVATTLDDHVDGSPMPLHIPRLSQGEIDIISKWITDGARNDAYFTGMVAPIFGTGRSLSPSVGGKCTLCHYPDAPSGMNVLNVFDPAQGMVDRASRYGGKIVAPGDAANSSLIKKLTGNATVGAPMPLHRPRLTEPQAEILRKWITAGAMNN
jgi:hypothetical protein